jgi:hypothetical protein
MLGERALHDPREGPHDSVAYRRDSLDCRMALLAVQQELGIFPSGGLGLILLILLILLLVGRL